MSGWLLIAVIAVVWLGAGLFLGFVVGSSMRERPRHRSSDRVPPRTTGR